MQNKTTTNSKFTFRQNTPEAWSRVFSHRKVTALFAAITVVLVISEQLYSHFFNFNYSPAYTQAGLLGTW